VCVRVRARVLVQQEAAPGSGGSGDEKRTSGESVGYKLKTGTKTKTIPPKNGGQLGMSVARAVEGGGGGGGGGGPKFWAGR
jgi:hypothetical protein